MQNITVGKRIYIKPGIRWRNSFFFFQIKTGFFFFSNEKGSGNKRKLNVLFVLEKNFHPRKVNKIKLALLSRMVSHSSRFFFLFLCRMGKPYLLISKPYLIFRFDTITPFILLQKKHMVKIRKVTTADYCLPAQKKK